MDKIIVFFNKYYKHLLGVVVIAGISSAFYFYNNNKQNEKISKNGTQYIENLISITSQNAEEPSKIYDNLELQAVAKNKDNFAALSNLLIAQSLISENKQEEGRVKLKEIFNNPGFNQLLKDYAMLLYAQNLLAEHKYDEFLTISSNLQKKDFTFKDNCIELLLIANIKAGNMKQVKEIIDSVNTGGEMKSNASIFERVKQIQAYVNYLPKN